MLSFTFNLKTKILNKLLSVSEIEYFFGKVIDVRIIEKIYPTVWDQDINFLISNEIHSSFCAETCKKRVIHQTQFYNLN